MLYELIDIDIEYELKQLDLKKPKYEYWDSLTDKQLLTMARRYGLESDPRIFNMLYNWEGKLSRKQRYLIIFLSAEIEKSFWI